MTSYDYSSARKSCAEFGLTWFGDEYAERQIGSIAKANDFTQQQIDVAFRTHLWQVKQLFEPSNYRWAQRVLIALYFLTGWRPNVKKRS